jgi:hypothetical protein
MAASDAILSADRAHRDAVKSLASSETAVAAPGSLACLLAALLPPRVALFVALLAWYLWAIVDLRLVFQDRDILFLWNVRYFTDFLGRPGSLLVWIDTLLVQSCYHGWPAATAIAAAAWLLFASTIGLMKVMSRGGARGVWVIPGILLVSLFSGYVFPTRVLFGAALAVTTANLWCRLPTGKPWVRVAVFVVISIALYCVAGTAYYCFAACCVVHEAMAERRRLTGALFLLAAVAVKFGLDATLHRLELGTHHFFAFTLAERQRPPLDWREAALYLYFPACALFAVYRSFISTLFKARGRSEDGTADGGSALSGSMIGWTGWTAVVLSLAAVAAYLSFDKGRKALLEIDYCAEHRRWDDLLAKAKRLPSEAFTAYVTHDVNLALYHTGRLAEGMFTYPQRFRCPALFVPDQIAQQDDRLLRKPCDYLLDLGRICEAERMAIELLETWPTGGALKRLALAEMIKDEPANARVMLNLLRDDLVWGGWAEEYLQRLTDDPTLAGDETIQRLRRLMLREDDLYVTSTLTSRDVTVDPIRLLLDSVNHNRANRMAFEYLMAVCLCNDDVQSVAEAYAFLDGLPYPATPPLYEQALLIYLAEHPQKASMAGSVVLYRGRVVSAATMEKYRRLKEIAGTYGELNERAEADVARELGSSYFYYYFYASRKRP